jgi:hypothetical protein
MMKTVKHRLYYKGICFFLNESNTPFGCWHWSLESGIGIRWHQYHRLDVTGIGNWKRERIPRGIRFTFPHPRANRSPTPRYYDAFVVSSLRRSPSPPPVGRPRHHPSSFTGAPPSLSLRRQATPPSHSFPP